MVEKLFADYVRTSAAHMYVIGFNLNGTAYLAVVSSLDVRWVRLDRESSARGGRAKLRMSLTNAVKAELLQSAKAIGQTANILSGDKNKGHAFEKWFTELNGQVWKRDRVPYYMDGDITLDGIKYQIKWENASLTTEKAITDALKWMAA